MPVLRRGHMLNGAHAGQLDLVQHLHGHVGTVDSHSFAALLLGLNDNSTFVDVNLVVDAQFIFG